MISAISRDDTDTKNVLENERVCERHFVSGRPSPNWDKFNVDWIPTLNLVNEYTNRKTSRLRQKEPRERRLEGKESLNDKRMKLQGKESSWTKAANRLLTWTLGKRQRVLHPK